MNSNQNANTGFVHSVKVPQLFKKVEKVVREVSESKKSLKTLLYEKGVHHPVCNEEVRYPCFSVYIFDFVECERYFFVG